MLLYRLSHRWLLKGALGGLLLLSGCMQEMAQQPAYRGYRLTKDELEAGLVSARLRITARDESPTSPYRYAREVFLRLEHI
jgi:hypothetical protein